MAEYIEREAAYEDFEKCNSKNPKWTPSRVKTLIARQKSADVAPVRHGRWIDRIDTDTHMHECSVCGARVIKGLYEYENQNRYCYHCGAKMDLEV